MRNTKMKKMRERTRGKNRKQWKKQNEIKMRKRGKIFN